MKKVLLTGGSGYVGKFTIKHLLKRNFIVHAVNSKPLDVSFAPASDNLIWHQTDLLSAQQTDDLIKKVRPTHLLHFAWFVEHGKFWSAAENLDWVKASLYLAKCFADSGGQRIVTAGTCAEYDWTRQNPFSESELPSTPQTLYGKSKSELATELERLADISGLSFASGKIFFTFGANESAERLIPSVILALLDNKPAVTSHGNQIRDYMHVADIAEGFVALLNSDVRGAVNVASGRKIKLRKIVETLGELLGKSELLQIGARPVAENEPPEIVANITRLTEEVNFNKEFDLRERLSETVDYWKRVYEIND